jgi:hypothetical protein
MTMVLILAVVFVLTARFAIRGKRRVMVAA